MSLLFMDGFDDRATGSANIIQKLHNGTGWLSVSGTSSIGAGVGMLGTNGLNLTANNRQANLTVNHTDTTVFWGVAIKPTNLAGSIDGIFYLFSSGTNHLTFNVETDLSISVRRGTHSGVELGRTAANICTGLNVFDFFEFKVTISDTVGAVNIWKGGVNVLSLSNVDTKNAGTTSAIDQIQFVGSSFFWVADNVYVGNTQGTGFTNVIGEEVHIDTVFPDTEGTTNQWTPSSGTDNSDTIDESPATNDSDYNAVAITGQIDEFNMGAVPTGHTMHGVQVSSWAQKSDAGAIGFRHRLRLGATVANSGDFTLGTGFGWFHSNHVLDPDGNPWTGTNLNAAEIGYEARP